MKPLVSILIPAYNKEKWIAETLQSALNQTWNTKEIIVVDDGSTDKTLDIIKSFKSKNLKIITQENMGACEARNKALSFAQGDYIQWLDADDLLDPYKIEKQLKRIEGNDDSRILLTSSWGKFFYSKERAKFSPDSLWQDLNPVEWIVNRFCNNVWMNPTVWLVSRGLTELSGGWNEKLQNSGDDDGEYICRIVSKSIKVKFIEEAKCYYRIGNLDSLDHSRSRKSLEAFIMAMKLCISHLLNLEKSERTKNASLKYLQTWVPFFYYEMPELLVVLNNEAKKLGKNLNLKNVDKKYKILRKYLGYRISNKIRTKWNKYKLLSQKGFDKAIYIIKSM